jgi:hypothetical protein
MPHNDITKAKMISVRAKKADWSSITFDELVK